MSICIRALLFSAIPVITHAVTLNEKITTPDEDYDIKYYNRDSTNAAFTSDANAQSIADHFDPASGDGIHNLHSALGFNAARESRRDVKLENDTGVPRANFTRILLPVPILNAIGHGGSTCRGICVHEGHHIHQYEYVNPDSSYGRTFGPWGFEGPATAMMDYLFASQDDTLDSNNYGWTHLAWEAGYLDTTGGGSVHDDYLFGNNGYESALWWRYLMEQWGSTRTEPQVGVDFLRRFYEIAGANKEGVGTTLQSVLNEKNRYTTSAADPGVSLEEAFQDFTIANWTRRFRSPQSWSAGFTFVVPDPGRFYYVDENPATSNRPLLNFFTNGSGNLANLTSLGDEQPSAAGIHSLSPGTNTGSQNYNVDKFAADYLKCAFTGTATGGYGLGFWAQTQDGAKASYSLVGRRSSGKIDLIEKGTTDPDSANSFKYATMQSATDPYIEFAAIVTGMDGVSSGGLNALTVNGKYYFSYFIPTLNILEPNSDYKAYVGDGAAPERFVTKVRVTSPDYLGGGSVTGLTKDNFKVHVGASTAPGNQGTIINAAYVLGEYWLTVQAPVKSPAPVGAQNLIVSLGTVTDTEQECVVYDNLHVDQMLVIDRSGSMTRTTGGMERIEAARAAAQLFVDASGSDDQIGVVRFSGDQHEPDASSYGDAQVIYSLDTMSSQYERDLINLLIDETNPGGDKLSPTGYTSIGDGLYWGAKEIVDNGQPEAEKWIILLSDGHQNEDSNWNAQRAFLQGVGIKVESIALGPNCDNNLLQSIATETSGRFYEVAAPEDAASARSAAGSSGFLRLDVAEAFLQSSERIHRRERILEESDTLNAGASRTITLPLAEGGLQDAVVTLFAQSSTANVGLTISRPDGSVVPAPDAGYTATALDPSGHYWNPEGYLSYRIPSMPDGTWSFQISNSGTASAPYLFVVSAKNKQGAQLRTYFAQYHGNAASYTANGLYLRGLPMPVVAVLTDGSGPIRGANLVATITHPHRPPVTLRLRDDGGSHDGAANDGVYAGIFAATSEASTSGGGLDETNPPSLSPSYQLHTVATGVDNLGRGFQRAGRGSFQVYEAEQGSGGDSDGDGMPDRYEQLHAGLNPGVNDSAGDLDGDLLDNFQEWHAGTDPGNVDTDGGGETDKSEADHSTNPLDSADDSFRRPLVARVLTYSAFDHTIPSDPAHPHFPKPGQNIVTISLERGHTAFEVWRSTAPTGPFTLIATVDGATSGGLYYDNGLINGTPYYYYCVPLGTGGKRGVSTHVFSGTPRSNAVPPQGSISINGNSPVTNSTTVAIAITASPDATQMRVGNKRNLSAVPWGPVTPFIGTHSLGALPVGAIASVYVEFADVEGNTTTYSDTIRYLAGATVGTFTGTVVSPLDTSNARSTLRFVSMPSLSITEVQTQPSGVFSVTLMPGTYHIRADNRGYAPFNLTGITLAAGATVNLGTINLMPLDQDADTLADVLELRDHDTNRFAADTDRDAFNDGTEVSKLKTNPLDPNSTFKVNQVVTSDPTGGTMTIRWASVNTVTYAFETSTDLTTWNKLSSGGLPVTVTATGPSTTTTLTLPSSGSKKYFVRVIVP